MGGDDGGGGEGGGGEGGGEGGGKGGGDGGGGEGGGLGEQFIGSTGHLLQSTGQSSQRSVCSLLRSSLGTQRAFSWFHDVPGSHTTLLCRLQQLEQLTAQPIIVNAEHGR